MKSQIFRKTLLLQILGSIAFATATAHAATTTRSIAYDCGVKGNSYQLLAINADHRFFTSPVSTGSDGKPEITEPTMGKWDIQDNGQAHGLFLHVQSKIVIDRKPARLIQLRQVQVFLYEQDDPTGDIIIEKVLEGDDGSPKPVAVKQPVVHCVRDVTQDGMVGGWFDRLPGESWH
ncbi:MAG: hypothetical protein AB1704_21815 [Pseudomonadota bacterium]|jgi:hypothetical protein|uniref:hypothetical protein n=1 Tax=Burkholderiaceae TaxID=119060 RepID=UPI0010F9A58C|nr:hypothetical protein [Burkholderia sp. 4M9327F10]